MVRRVENVKHKQTSRTHFFHVTSGLFFGHVLGRYAAPSPDGLLDVAGRARRRRQLAVFVRLHMLPVAPLFLFLQQ